MNSLDTHSEALEGRFMALQEGDFVEIQYTGVVVEDGLVFDTTDAKVARAQGIPTSGDGRIVVCIGKHQLLPALDASIAGKAENEKYSLELSPEQAFGKKDAKNMRMFPLSTFKKHKINPVQGLRVEIDDQYGTVRSVAGGRIIVDFNHPLASKAITYKVQLGKKVTELAEQAKWWVALSLQIPSEKVHAQVAGNKATIQVDGLKKDEEATALSNVFKATLPRAIPAITDVVFTKQ